MNTSFPKKKKSIQYANIDMDKFKFNFHLFVPSKQENDTLTNDTEMNP